MGCESSQQIMPHEAREVSQLPDELNTLIAKADFATVERIGDGYFKEKKYLQAIAVYKKAIQAGYTVDFQIEGLGSFNFETYYYQWWPYKWYDEQRQSGKFKGNMFDALSMCYCKIMETNEDEMEKGTLWYEDRLSERETYELYIGYAHILYNRYKYDPALKAYNKVMALKPDLLSVYISIMFLHEFNRVEKAKSKAMAEKVLKMNPDNPYGLFVLGKNAGSADEKIVALKAGVQKHPNYIRMINEVGLAYGSKGDSQSAREWYKKCVDLAPNDYAQGYQNYAYRSQQLKEYEVALDYYYRAVELDSKYKQAFINAIRTFKQLNLTDEAIIAKISEYPKIDRFNFHYYLGLAYYDLPGNVQTSLVWYKRAQALDPNSFNVYNSMGLAYDQLKDYENAETCYRKSMELNPKYKFPPYNMGLMFKHKGDEEKAIEWYLKSIEITPDYHPPYNNLANIYRDKGDLEKAIKLYRKGVEVHSTYTLGYCNMAMCLLKLEMYQDAFNAFSRAKELLPTDNNGMTEGNKAFLRENLEKFDKEGQKWRKTGYIGLEQKQQLQSLIRSFEANFKLLYSGEVTFKRGDDVVLKPAILEIVRLVHKGEFELDNIEQIFELVKHTFHDDEEYFHIVPQLFIQYFWKSSFTKKTPILDIEAKLFNIIKSFSNKEAGLIPKEATTESPPTFKMKNFDPPSDFKVNLFKDTAFFSSYEILYSEIDKVNKLAEKSLPQYIEFVDGIRKRSNGIPYGVNMKMPKRADQQFKVILRILEKMFKKELNEQRVKDIISKIDERLKAAASTGKVTLVTIVHEIMEVWTKEITLILAEREKDKVETTCGISDLLRGKLMFHSVQDVGRAVEACDKLCVLRGYKVLELDNRLLKPQTQDVVLKLQVGEAVAELQLALKQDESKYHFIHSIYEIERSPLGCIFGSYLFMSKGFNYPFLANCKDIAERLATRTGQVDRETCEAANFIIKALEEK